MSGYAEDPPGSGLYVPWDLSEVESGLYASLPTATDFTYRGIHIDQSGPFYLQGVDGWAGFSADFDDVPVGGGHGSLLTPGRVGARLVTISGVCASVELRNSLFWALRRMAGASITAGAATSELVGYHAGVDLTAYAQVKRWQPTVAQGRWSKGVFGFDIEFRCPDPMLYGGTVNMSSPFPQAGAGMSLPASLPAAFPDAVPGGGFTVNNPGTAPAPATFTVTGPVEWPGVMVTSGGVQRRVIYQLNIASGDSLVISTQDGGAGLLNGEYRIPYGGSNLTSDMVLWPGENVIQGLGRATAGDPLPAISLSYRPAYL